MNKLTIEISSYPKSGNTWVRHIFREVLRGTNASRIELATALHQRGAQQIKSLEPIEISSLGLSLRLYKSHICDHPELNPNRVLYAYRHPLDVLFSALNFHATQALMLGKKVDLSVFRDARPKMVEQMLSDGDISYYFDRFLADAGASLFPRSLTGVDTYFDHVGAALDNPKVVGVKYEDMCSDVAGAIEPAICEVLGLSQLGATINYNYINKNTKGSDRKDFFWKASSGGYVELLSAAQVDRLCTHYQQELKNLGYL
ncbi:sulfotransferase domain-containing protein [uncultured Umboniibacter sp.]|uniref:sulfotransferase domain-containing protein n=1 Tax=uncultured Umboniibacter sp. TaxID=1798917 RepID=UPI00261C47DA|nr:sulfotransferase domain-containing protein [uncultured Umboniibacter sp.]